MSCSLEKETETPFFMKVEMYQCATRYAIRAEHSHYILDCSIFLPSKRLNKLVNILNNRNKTQYRNANYELSGMP